jgi:hypothetical protein
MKASGLGVSRERLVADLFETGLRDFPDEAILKAKPPKKSRLTRVWGLVTKVLPKRRSRKKTRR